MRRWLLVPLLLACGLGVTETLAWLAFAVVEPDGYDRPVLHEERVEILAAVPAAREAAATRGQPTGAQVLHPFLGFVVDPAGAREPVSPQGFPLAAGAAPPAGRAPGDVVVAIVGGSVAKHLAVVAGDELKRRLEAAGVAPGGRVWIENLAIPSYKQPQQLMSLAWRLAHEAPPDVVVNVDGFNEVVLGWVHNVPAGVNPFWPLDWRTRVAGAAQPEILRLLGRLEVLLDRRRELAKRHERWLLAHSVVGNLVWARLDHTLVHRIARLEEELLAARGAEDGRSFRLYGPDGSPSDRDRFLDEASALWGRASFAMDGMCRRMGVAYVHVLQPNQYVPGSKPMSTTERHRAYDPDLPYADQVNVGYPRLVGVGRALAAQGVAFHDLTGLFADHEETLYVDACCHLNADGNRLLAAAVADAVADSLREPVASAPDPEPASRG